MTEFVRYDKTHDSLTQGLGDMIQKIKDLPRPAGPDVLHSFSEIAKKAADMAKDRKERELRPFKEIEGRWDPLIESFTQIYNRMRLIEADLRRKA